MSNVESQSLATEVRRVLVCDDVTVPPRTEDVMAFEFAMDTEGSFFYQGGMERHYFVIPPELEGYFTRFEEKRTLWCTWRVEGISLRPTAIAFQGSLLPLK